jgi:4-amino-4-deoxy-L-arabinose transferase-like glycosyltransferase
VRLPFLTTGPAWLAFAGLAFVILASQFALRVQPNSNEAWFADPPRNLLRHGHLGTTILSAEGTWLEGIDRHTYWAMPVDLLAQAAWYSLFGFSLLSMRLLSVAAGLGLVLAWFLFASQLLANRTLALVAAGLLAVDVRLARFAANGRMDALCAFLGVTGLAAFLLLRTRSPRVAALAGHAGVVLSVLTHPCGMVYVLDLVVLQVLLDGWRPACKRWFWVLAPYAVFGAAFGAWALQDWTSFVRQIGGNVSGIAGEFSGAERFGGLTRPWAALLQEMENRYFRSFGGWAALAVLWTYAASVVWTLVRPAMRIDSRVRLLLMLAGIHFTFFWLFEGLKLTNYLVHLLPILATLAVLAGRDFLEVRPRARIAFVAIVVVLQVTAAFQELRGSSMRTAYLPVVDLLQRHPGLTVTGPAEFAFAVGFEGALRDDLRLGYYSGRRPDLFITNGWQRDWLERADKREPAVARAIRQKLKSEFREIYRNSDYVVWKRVAVH